MGIVVAGIIVVGVNVVGSSGVGIIVVGLNQSGWNCCGSESAWLEALFFESLLLVTHDGTSTRAEVCKGEGPLSAKVTWGAAWDGNICFVRLGGEEIVKNRVGKVSRLGSVF